MQDTTNLPNGDKIVREDAPQGQLPPTFLAELAAAEAVLIISGGDGQPLVIRPVVKGGIFEPGHVATHALVDAIMSDFDNLVRRVNGKPTDAQRFQALRDFAVLGTTDKERFEVVNNMIQKFEENSGLPAEADRTAADFEKIADFVVMAMIETAPLVVETPPVPN